MIAILPLLSPAAAEPDEGELLRTPVGEVVPVRGSTQLERPNGDVTAV